MDWRPTAPFPGQVYSLSTPSHANASNSVAGLGLGLITAIDSGGPGARKTCYASSLEGRNANALLVIYGFILVFILQSCVGASLAEFVSAYPTEGGMYHWIAAIAPRRYNSVLSFATGWCTVFGCTELTCFCSEGLY